MWKTMICMEPLFKPSYGPDAFDKMKGISIFHPIFTWICCYPCHHVGYSFSVIFQLLIKVFFLMTEKD